MLLFCRIQIRGKSRKTRLELAGIFLSEHMGFIQKNVLVYFCCGSNFFCGFSDNKQSFSIGRVFDLRDIISDLYDILGIFRKFALLQTRKKENII